jgi:hypothetical protein
MTTDLTGDFEMGEDELDWDVFLPDPDVVDVEAEAAALEDEAELSLDDSDFDWDGALRDDTRPGDGAESDTRSVAAYDRIVDTVRRSVEEDSPADADTQPEADTIAAPIAADESETRHDTELEPDVTGLAAPFADAATSEADVERVVEWASDAALEPDDEPAAVIDLEAGADLQPEADLEPEIEGEPELDHWLTVDDDPLLAETDPEPVRAFEPAQATEPIAPRFAEATTTFAVVGAVESAGLHSSGADATWAMAPAEPWEVDDPAEFASAPAPTGSREDGEEKPKRSRVFKATVVLACLFAIAVAAAVTVRTLHHPTTTTAAPPTHVTTPTQATTGTAASGTSAAKTTASGSARIQAATDAVDSATTAASVGLTSLAAFPTPTNVETVINPYISSLQLYETFLSGTTVPAPGQPTAASAEAKIRQDLQFLETIDGLPPQQLGAFLVQFDTDATQLQTTLSTLEQDLRSPAS